MALHEKWGAMSSKLSTRLQEKEAVAAIEVVASAAAFSFLNIYKANSAAGTYRVGVKADGSGGVDVDLLAGVALSLAGLLIPSQKGGSHLLAFGAGALANWGARTAGQQALKRKQTSASTAGVGATLSSYYRNSPLPPRSFSSMPKDRAYAGVRAA